jgi:hypothetical protein
LHLSQHLQHCSIDCPVNWGSSATITL